MIKTIRDRILLIVYFCACVALGVALGSFVDATFLLGLF